MGVACKEHAGTAASTEVSASATADMHSGSLESHAWRVFKGCLAKFPCGEAVRTQTAGAEFLVQQNFPAVLMHHHHTNKAVSCTCGEACSL